jgi:hypothetical protein
MAQTLPARQKTKESVALAAFFNIAEKWQLKVAEQMNLLGMDVPATYYNAKKDPTSARVGKDMLERLSYILGIFSDLQVLLPDITAADAWIKKPNTASLFGGKSALDFLIEGGSITHLDQVRRYLAHQRGV